MVAGRPWPLQQQHGHRRELLRPLVKATDATAGALGGVHGIGGLCHGREES
jgi:hypothetical protein